MHSVQPNHVILSRMRRICAHPDASEYGIHHSEQSSLHRVDIANLRSGGWRVMPALQKLKK